MKKSAIAIACILHLIYACNTDKAVTRKFRPLLHFSTTSGWINDPNGLVYLEGEYHLFYQYNPDTIVWGPMHWGHAVSNDLIHWQHLPIALSPDSLGTIFSGSCVFDKNNTSGLGTKDNPPLVAIYTSDGRYIKKPEREKLQEQCLAYSTDKGRSWTKYKRNPVLPSMNIDFRDPKVMWYEPLRQWVMTLAAGHKIMFFNSPNLKDWHLTGTFQYADTTIGVYECPDLFPMPVNENAKDIKWVMLTSYTSGAPSGSCGTSYIVGDFDGKTFSTSNSNLGWFDYGADNYAGVTFSNISPSDGRRLFLGWMSNWWYADKTPAKTWRGNMTIPRQLSLVNTNSRYTLKSFPVNELKALYADSLKYVVSSNSFEIKKVKLLQDGCFVADFIINNPVDSFNIVLSNNTKQYIALTYANQILRVNRKNSSRNKISDFFVKDQYMPINDPFPLKLHLVYDKSTVEIFANDGASSMSELVFPDNYFNCIKMKSDGQKFINANVNISKLK